MPVEYRWPLILWLTLFTFSPAGATEPAESAESNPPASDLPSLELLEFLGEWETGSGDWIDPSSLIIESTTVIPQ